MEFNDWVIILVALVKVYGIEGLFLFLKLVYVVAVNSTCGFLGINYRIPTPSNREINELMAKIQKEHESAQETESV